MIITDLAIDRRTTVFVLIVLIVIAGLYSYIVLPRESNPEIVIPILLVTTTYQGVAPEDMESLVTIPIERKLTGLSGVKSLRSSSSEGVSVIQIEFEAELDVDAVRQKVRDRVDQALPDLPPEADDPMIAETNISEFPFMYVSMLGDMSPAFLTTIAEDLAEELESLKGILEVQVVGDVEREIQIIVDPERVNAYGIPLSELVQLARVENVNTPAGALDLGEAKYLVRVPGEFKGVDDLRNLVVKAGEGGIVYLRDIAEVRDGHKEVETLSRLNGRPAITLALTKRAGENVIRVSADVRKNLDAFASRLLPGMELMVTMDYSEDIQDMVRELENNILSGLILVLVVIFAFLGLANALMVSLAIPMSMLIAFAALYISDTTLNMVVLFSLMLALGMLVDNGIVVVENMYRHLQLGLSPAAAAKTGASEVAWPIITSTLTTVAAFAPMFFWPGVWGSFMFFLPQTLCIALTASLFVGLVLNPAIASRAFRARRGAVQSDPEAVGAHRGLVIRLYGAALRLALRRRMPTVVLAITLLVTITAIFFHDPRIEFTPSTEPRRIDIDVDCPEGTRLETTDAIVREIESRIAVHRENAKYVIANVGSRGSGFGLSNFGANSHQGRVTMNFKPAEEMTLTGSAIVEDIRKRLDDIVGARLTFRQEEYGPSEAAPVNIEISGEDFSVLAKLAQDVEDRIQGLPGLTDVRNNYEAGNPEVRVRVDREQALLTGLNTEYVGQAVLAAIYGRKAGVFREGDKEYDVMVRFPESFRKDLTQLQSMLLTNLQGTPIPFSAAARVEEGVGLGAIQRVNRKRTITVSGDTASQEISGAELLKQVQELLAGFELPSGCALRYTGQNEEQEEAQAFLGRAFIVALFLIALVLITQFNSVLQPFIIMTSVILSLAGVFLGLLITGMPFSVIMTGIGCISLAGVVVNNAIVMLDFINQRRREGLALNDAIVDAASTRFRPVMLTAVTTVLGLIPMAVGISFDFINMRWIVGGESSQWWGPMAVAVIFGLAFATLLTLIVVPVLYSLLAALSIAKVEHRA